MKYIQLSKDFNLGHFACKCENPRCTPNMDLGFIRKLQLMQDYLPKHIKLVDRINSGYRCHDHNKAVGGTPSSMHTLGRAVDIQCFSILDRYELLRAAFLAGFNDISVAKTFVHVDVRSINQTRLY
jgi:uncharacterized protein YcbK (DUF882 family)